MAGLQHAWDVGFAPDGAMFFTERPFRLWVRTPEGVVRRLQADFGDQWASGETGLMAVEVDPGFLGNRRIYTCQGTTDLADTVQVVAWVVDAAYTTATRVNDPLVGGIDGRSGRHGGCQLRIDHEGFLHVGTGDAAHGSNPQDLASLAGKTLRVDRFTGAAAPGNVVALLGGDPRIFTYGHRNVQGLALRPGTLEVWSTEHGPGIEDEINRLVNGGNYGWDPPLPYDESVPMTDLEKFPDAVPAVWSSGPTIAVSGATFLDGPQWGPWNGHLAVSTLNGRRVHLFPPSGNGLGASFTLPQLSAGDRFRAAELGPDGALYVTTDNGSNDRILAVRPTAAPFAGVGAVASAAGRVDLAGRELDDTVSTRAFVTSWTAPTSIGGLTRHDPDAASSASGRLDVFVRGVDGRLWHRPRTGTTLGPWQSVGDGRLTSAPAAVSWAPGRIDVFGRGLDGQLWANALVNGTWFGWYPLGGGLTSEPEAASWAADRLDVVIRGLDGALWHRAWTGTTWSPWSSLGGLLTSGPGAASASSGRLDVFGRGWDDALWTRRWNGSSWSPWSSLGGSLESSPEAMVPAAGRLELLARGVDGAVHRRSFDGAAWGPWGPIG